MKIVYNESLTKEIVENYFRTYEDIDGELEIKCGMTTIPSIGRSVVPLKFASISFILKGTMKVGEEMQKVEIKVSERDVKNAFISRVEASGRKVNEVEIDFDEKEFKGVVVDATAKRRVR